MKNIVFGGSKKSKNTNHFNLLADKETTKTCNKIQPLSIREEVKCLYGQGLQEKEIAKKLNITLGEVNIVLSL